MPTDQAGKPPFRRPAKPALLVPSLVNASLMRTDWLDVTGPQAVRDHLAAIGAALVARYS